MFSATETFFVGATMIPKGKLVPDNDPILKGRGHLFEKVGEPSRVALIERASAAPGEKRSVPALGVRNALVAAAKALGIPAKGTNADLTAAIEAAKAAQPAGGLTTADLPQS